MNRIFVFLVLAGAGAAFLLDVFGPPQHVAPGAVVDAKSDARLTSVKAPPGASVVFAAAPNAPDKVVATVAVRKQPPTTTTLSFADLADAGDVTVRAGDVLALTFTAKGPVKASTLAAGLIRLKEFGPGVKRAPQLAKVTQGMLDMASVAAKLALGLIGILALWMGVLRVAEAGGVVELLAKLLRPILVRLFPDVPPDHPAMGAMVMNIAANMLGLGNAATPLGLEAMKRLQELNPNKRTASNAMVLFLAINTSGLTLLPTKTIALRAENGSADPVAILVPTLLATLASTIVAISIAKLLAPRFAVEEDGPVDKSVDDNRMQSSAASTEGDAP